MRKALWVLLLAIALCAAWLAFMPAQIAVHLKQAIELRTGRSLVVASGSSLVMSPQFGVALNDVTLAGSSALAEPVLRARKLIVPISFAQLIVGQASADSLIFDGADLRVVLNAKGHANVLIEQTPEAGKTDADAKSLDPLQIKINDGTFHFSDLRNGNDFELHQLSAVIDYGDVLTTTGSADVKDQHINFTASLNSLTRAFAEGSPLDLTVDGVGSVFSFSGRIATHDNLNLAGQATLESTETQRLFAWLGAKLKGFEALKKLSLEGALDSQGPVFLVKQAKLKLEKINAEGEISFSNASERPNLTASFDFNDLDLGTFLLAERTSAKSWDEKAIDIANLNALDLQFHLVTKSLIYNSLKTGTATIDGTLKDRMLSAAIKSDAVAGGQARFDLNFDARQLPPEFKLGASVSTVEAKSFLSALFGQDWLSGPLTLTGNLSARGVSQADMVSTLSGDIDAKLENGNIKQLNFENAKDLQARFSLAEGVVTMGENNFSGSGEIDILRRALTIAVGKQSITGTWDAPKIASAP
jgi:AsmA protein